MCPPTTQTTPTSSFSFTGAVSSDVAVCANMSAQILRDGGSAVDAGITAMLCNGAVHPESSGIGGGGFMVVRETSGCVYAISFRESAPAKSTVNMFHSSETSASRVREGGDWRWGEEVEVVKTMSCWAERCE